MLLVVQCLKQQPGYGNNPKCPIRNEWIKKLLYINIYIYKYIDMTTKQPQGKMKLFSSLTETLMELEGGMLK